MNNKKSKKSVRVMYQIGDSLDAERTVPRRTKEKDKYGAAPFRPDDLLVMKLRKSGKKKEATIAVGNLRNC